MRIGDFPSAVFEKCTSFVMKNPGKIALTVAAIWGAFSFARAFKEAQNFIKEPEDKPEEKFQEPKWRPRLSTIKETDESEENPQATSFLLASPKPFCRRQMSVSIPSEDFLEIPPLQGDLTGDEAIQNIRDRKAKNKWGQRFIGDFNKQQDRCLQS
ncbi:MAG: hypothetical protein FJZ62_01410 [Chlamydiae bacterium]|nr:hypothetical protein [Chlamydiota bacterium]